MSKHTYRTTGTCSVGIAFDLEDNIVTNIQFERGCNGNAKGVAILASGMKADELINKLEGIRCESKNTSCPDQLAQAIKKALAEE